MMRARGARRPRFRLLPTVLLTLAILGLPTVVYAWGRTSSSFDVVGVRVTGTHLVSAKRTLRLLRHTYLGDNLFAVTASDVRATLQPLSFISGVAVDRDFPDTLAVTIEEYVPVAYALSGDRWYVLDAHGYAICTAPAAGAQLGKAARPAEAHPSPPASAAATEAAGEMLAAGTAAAGSSKEGPGDLLARLLTGPKDAPLPLPRIAVAGRVRQGAAVTGAAAGEMLAVITALPRSLQRGLAAVQDEDGRLTLRFAGGPVARWGDAERTLAKTVALRTVLAAYARAGKRCTQIDVSIPDRVLAKPVLQ